MLTRVVAASLPQSLHGSRTVVAQRLSLEASNSPLAMDVPVRGPVASSTCPMHLDVMNVSTRAALAGRLDKIAPLRRRLPHVDGVRRAAVLIPLCIVQNSPSVLFTVRSDSVGSHKNEVSFPGGHREEGEMAVHTAAREAAEELGLPNRSFIDVLGCYHDMIALSGTHVTPVVGTIVTDGLLQPNPDEVTSYFTLPISHLVDPENRSYQDLQVPYDASSPAHRVPVFHGGLKPVWGLTAFVLDQVLRDVLMPFPALQHP